MESEKFAIQLTPNSDWNEVMAMKFMMMDTASERRMPILYSQLQI
jgi:hypothetical protein